MKAKASTLIVALLLQCTISLTHGSEILGLMPYPGKSHFDFFRPLFRGLAEAGHKVTVISYFPNKEPIANYTDVVLTGMPIIANNIDLKVFENEQDVVAFKVPIFFLINDWGQESCEAAFNSEAIKGLIKTKPHFDVIIIEQFSNDCMMAIAHVLKAPVVALSSCAIMPWHFKRMGSPFIPSFMPVNSLPHTDQMGFVDRLNNVFHYHAMNFLYDYITQKATNEMIKKYLGNDIPPIEELVKQTSAMLINQHFSLTGSMPYAPGIVEISGLQIQDPVPLDTELKTLLDTAKKGVIYVSLGSMIRPETLSVDRREALLTALSKWEGIVLMKWSGKSLPNRPDNVITREWMPQREILCHPNVVLFLSHGGLLGTSEAVYCGVPLVVTPIYGDQFLNAMAIQKRKIGTILRYQDMSSNSISQAIITALNPEIRENAKFISSSFRNRPQTPLKLAVWWVEYVIQNKGLTLVQNTSTNLSLFSYHCLDVYALLLCIILLLLWIIVRLFKFILARLRSDKFKNDTNKKNK